MKMGTKSLLFGAHQFILHPIFVLVAWVHLYSSWPNWRELVCIIIHDWGYWGCSDMDGEEGEKHPRWAAKKIIEWFGTNGDFTFVIARGRGPILLMDSLCLFHSRFLAKKQGFSPSNLCWADKLGTAMYPVWLWVFLCRITGELGEYMSVEKHVQAVGTHTDPRNFFRGYREIVAAQLKENVL